MSKWSYKATRSAEGMGVIATVEINNGNDKPRIYPLHHFVRHSPTGFEMGYGGSGPADLAYSILVHWFLSYKFSLDEAKEEANAHYQEFKWKFIAPVRDNLAIGDDEIEHWWTDRVEAGQSPTQFVAEAEGGQSVTLTVHDTATRAEITRYGRYLIPEWCECERSEFLCYPGDGECSCGILKHHVHCKNCGGVSQVG